MTHHDAAHRYFQAWNDHDAGAVVACFAADGSYSDPAAGQLRGPALAGYVTALQDAFADLHFEPGPMVVEGDRVVVPWLMTGTHTGAFASLPPTGAALRLPGVDVLELGPDGISTVHGYFDRQTFAEQLGLQVAVQPPDSDALAFGTVVRVRSAGSEENTDHPRPGALSLTWMDVRSPAEQEQVRGRSLALATELSGLPGFVGWLGIAVGLRLYTVTLWTGPECLEPLRAHPRHREGVRLTFGPELAAAVHTGVWVPDHLNPLWQRCAGCDRLIDPSRLPGSCSCGAALPARVGYL